MLRVWDIQLGMIVVVAGIKIGDVLPNFMMEPSIIMFSDASYIVRGVSTYQDVCLFVCPVI